MAADDGASTKKPRGQGLIEALRSSRALIERAADSPAQRRMSGEILKAIDALVATLDPKSALETVLTSVDDAAAPEDAGTIEELRRDVEQLRIRTSHELSLLDLVLDQSPAGVIVSDASGRLVLQNQAAQRIWAGSATADDVEGWGLYRAYHPDGRPYAAEDWAMARCLTHRATVEAEEVHFQRFDGTHGYLLGSCAPLVDGNGTLVGAVSVFSDITKFKGLEREYLRLREDTERQEGVARALREQVRAYSEADEAKTMFLATASHELKTPLSVIQGFAQLLASARDIDADRREEAITAIERRAAELNRIVDRLLLSSRIETGRVVVDVRPTDVGHLIEERTADLERASSRDVSIVIENGIPRASADAEALVTVLDHLLDNAVKYSPEGAPIRVRASSDGSWVWFEVADEGVGMTQAESERCFDKFWQAERADVRRVGGAGIGLFIVRSLVESMGGTIRVESTPGVGSKFFVSLRKAAVGRTSEDPDREHAHTLASFARTAHGVRALVIEGESAVRQLVVATLVREGVRVVQTSDGRHALEILASGERPDVIILDVEVPVLDGWETLRAIRENPVTAGVPVVMMTVADTRQDLARGWRLGCDGYIMKPFSPDDLVDEIAVVLLRPEEERVEVRRREMSKSDQGVA